MKIGYPTITKQELDETPLTDNAEIATIEGTDLRDYVGKVYVANAACPDVFQRFGTGQTALFFAVNTLMYMSLPDLKSTEKR